ncbi:alginate O-acetyltransferase AlgX-related protein [Brachyspira pulli]|uniref:alginate O-acetyltransferase AlgX-related protein n=1 Tax=Brachyspira pulli TaxID=310721 RepID=UPI003005A177
MWNIIKKILIVFEILAITFLITFFLLGKKERVCYLTISLYPPLSYSNNYVYNFQVEYYTKVFRNSDIYGVYLNTNSFPNYIKDIKVQDGIRYGRLTSTKELDSKIDNIKYTLKFKFKFMFYMFVFIILFFILIFSSKINSFFVSRNICRIIEIKYLWITIIFLSALILPNVVYTMFYKHFNHENLDNRNFNEYPNIQSNFIDFPKNYEAYFNDYLPFRNELIILKKDIDKMFNERGDTIKGSNGMLFAKDPLKFNTGEIDFSLEELKIIKDNLVLFRDELKKKNIEFVLFIAPNKATVYYDLLPKYVKLKDVTTIDKLVLYLTDNTDINVVYPKEEMIKYKNLYELYYLKDVHWNDIGGYLGYLELMKALNMTNELIPIENVTILKEDTLDQYKLTNYTKNHFNIIEGANNHYYSKQDNYYSYSESDVSNDYNILFIRDSYGYHMFNYIASSFHSTIFLHRGLFNIDYIKERDINLVVLEYAGFAIKDLLKITDWRIEEINKN